MFIVCVCKNVKHLHKHDIVVIYRIICPSYVKKDKKKVFFPVTLQLKIQIL